MAVESALIIGSGGREHAIGLSIADSVDQVYFAPGNAGTASIPNGENVDVKDSPVTFAKEHSVGLTIIGPEAPLVAGLADNFRYNRLDVVGPNANAAQLEASKSFACEFMKRQGIPFPSTHILTSTSQIDQFIRDLVPDEWVLKVDGLAGGKGVVLPESDEEMRATLYGMLSGELFDGAGKNCTLIQERLNGPEVSVFVMTDGENFVILPSSQDHKRLENGDKGLNTGGMGSYSPVPSSIVSPEQAAKIQEIAAKTVAGMKAEEKPYQGTLYLGLMLADEYDGDPVVIEYNARFGDPEAQVVLPILQQSGVDVYELFKSVADNRLNAESVQSGSLIGRSALTVCLAAEGYPNSPKKGEVINGLDKTYGGVVIHHGGTKRNEEAVVTNGGRVIYVTGTGETVDEAAAKAYAAIGPDGVNFAGMQYRTDIGKQAR